MTYDIDQLVQLYHDYCAAGPAYLQTPRYLSDDALWSALIMYEEAVLLGEISPATDAQPYCGLNDDQIMYILNSSYS